MYYDHGTRMHYDHCTCMYCDHCTWMYYDHSTCTYYGHSACIMFCRAHVRRKPGVGSGGELPQKRRVAEGPIGHSMRSVCIRFLAYSIQCHCVATLEGFFPVALKREFRRGRHAPPLAACSFCCGRSFLNCAFVLSVFYGDPSCGLQGVTFQCTLGVELNL